MPCFTIPNVDTPLLEFNDCHTPAGSPVGGQFCSKQVTFNVETGPLRWRTVEGTDEAFRTVLGPKGTETLSRIVEAIPTRGRLLRLTVSPTAGVVTGRMTVPGAIDDFTFELRRVVYQDPPKNTVIQVTTDGTGELNVSLESIKVSSSQQGKGVAKQLLRHAMTVFDQMGVEQATLLAALDVGGYAWAKFGFRVWKPEALADGLVSSMPTLTRMLKLSPEKGEAISTLIQRERNNPKLPQIVAGLRDGDQMVGKELLLIHSQYGWVGRLRRDDPDAMAEFWKYVGGRP